MPFFLFAHMYRSFQKRSARDFDKHNHVLSLKEIEAFLAGGQREIALRIFESAVVDHAKLDDVAYYLDYPVKSLFAHDGHKRALIAYGCAALFEGRDEAGRRRAKRILAQFIQTDEAGYVQVMAWASLAKIVKNEGGPVEEFAPALMRSFAHTSASLMGALIYLETFLATPQAARAVALAQKAAAGVLYRAQRMLLHFFWVRHGAGIGLIHKIQEQDIRDFLARRCARLGFSKVQLYAGLVQLGLLSAHQKLELWENTSQKRIADLLMPSCGDYLGAIGAFFEGG